MTLGYRHPIGPLKTSDIVGLDVRLAIAEHLASELGPRFEPPQLLRDKVAAGELGRKTGRGFYDWGGRSSASPSNTMVVIASDSCSPSTPPPARCHSTSELTIPNSNRLTRAGGTS